MTTTTPPVFDEALVQDLEALATWSEDALSAWLGETDPQVRRRSDESESEYRGRCVEAWTASFGRAEAEEAAADEGARLARVILERLAGTSEPRRDMFTIDHRALAQWWNEEVDGWDVECPTVGEIFDNAALAVVDFVHNGSWLTAERESLRLQIHVTCDHEGNIDGFVLAIEDQTWPRSPYRLCVATGFIDSADLDRNVDAIEFATAIVEIANKLFAGATQLRVA